MRTVTALSRTSGEDQALLFGLSPIPEKGRETQGADRTESETKGLFSFRGRTPRVSSGLEWAARKKTQHTGTGAAGGQRQKADQPIAGNEA